MQRCLYDEDYLTKGEYHVEKKVEELLIAGGENEKIRSKYDAIKSMDDFVALAGEEGYEFSSEDLQDVLRESGDSFESFGNPAKRMIWWF